MRGQSANENPLSRSDERPSKLCLFEKEKRHNLLKTLLKEDRMIWTAGSVMLVAPLLRKETGERAAVNTIGPACPLAG